jgi:endonuclease YncB( thermonuclease family)
MGELPKSWEGQAYAVTGDTLSAIGLKPRLRLWGIRSPAIAAESVSGMRARAALEDMLASADHRVSCRMTGWDSACLAVALCTVTAEWPTGSKAAAHDVAVRMVEDGFAYGALPSALPEWDKDAAARIAHFESLARQARKGLWPAWLGDVKTP